MNLIIKLMFILFQILFFSQELHAIIRLPPIQYQKNSNKITEKTKTLNSFNTKIEHLLKKFKPSISTFKYSYVELITENSIKIHPKPWESLNTREREKYNLFNNLESNLGKLFELDSNIPDSQNKKKSILIDQMRSSIARIENIEPLLSIVNNKPIPFTPELKFNIEELTKEIQYLSSLIVTYNDKSESKNHSKKDSTYQLINIINQTNRIHALTPPVPCNSQNISNPIQDIISNNADPIEGIDRIADKIFEWISTNADAYINLATKLKRNFITAEFKVPDSKISVEFIIQKTGEILIINESLNKELGKGTFKTTRTCPALTWKNGEIKKDSIISLAYAKSHSTHAEEKQNYDWRKDPNYWKELQIFDDIKSKLPNKEDEDNPNELPKIIANTRKFNLNSGQGIIVQKKYDWNLSQLFRQTLDDKTKLRILLNVIGDIANLHKLGLVHNDIKPQNILITEDRAALSDFGITYDLAQTNSFQFGGTRSYSAPEIFTYFVDENSKNLIEELRIRNKPKYDQARDIFSFGITALNLFISKHDFEKLALYPKCWFYWNDDPRNKDFAICINNNQGEFFQDLQNKANEICRKKPNSCLAMQMIVKCLNPDPLKRPTAAELSVDLNSILSEKLQEEARRNEVPVYDPSSSRWHWRDIFSCLICQ